MSRMEEDYPEVLVDPSKGPIRPLYNDEDLDWFAKGLRQRLAKDDTAEVREALRGEFGRSLEPFGGWFQRIEFPSHGLSTSSDPGRCTVSDPGPLNSVWGRLSAEEGTRLRPYPKWAYLRSVLPRVVDKTVLDIGSSCGFFSFQFAALGAAAVTGVEIIPGQHAQSVWAAKQLGVDHTVQFLNTDGFLDHSLEQHDVVFMSEVFIHSILPFYSLLRCINLAKECVVIDDFFARDPERPASLKIFRDMGYGQGKIFWTGFGMTERLLFEALYIFGVEPERVTRYHGNHDHAVVIIDTRGVREFREKVIGHPSLQSMLELQVRAKP